MSIFYFLGQSSEFFFSTFVFFFNLFYGFVCVTTCIFFYLGFVVVINPVIILILIYRFKSALCYDSVSVSVIFLLERRVIVLCILFSVLCCRFFFLSILCYALSWLKFVSFLMFYCILWQKYIIISYEHIHFYISWMRELKYIIEWEYLLFSYIF